MAVACRQLHPRPVTNRPAAGAPALRLVAKGGLASERYVAEVAAAVAAVTRTCRLSAGEAEDLQSDLWVRLLEHDGRVLRSFRGRARIGTYLVTIARNLVFDRRNKEWGRWRPSSAARRAGAEAVELERMMSRDGWTLDAAAESLKLAGTLSAATLAATLAHTLPVRTRRHFVDVSVLESIAAHGSDPGGASLREQEHLASELQRVLAGALDTLSEYRPAAVVVAVCRRHHRCRNRGDGQRRGEDPLPPLLQDPAAASRIARIGRDDGRDGPTGPG